jgi:16S rRNA (guanine527-N7)-methyltransferase
MSPHRQAADERVGRTAHPILAEATAETLRRLSIYAELLKKWRRAVNLVGPGAVDDLWVRHFADSLQVSGAAPQARRWVDLGSGAGFPGLVTAIRYADEPSAEVHLIESDQRKCAFLRDVSRETGARAQIHCGRIETILPHFDRPIDAVSARALAPLPVLLSYAAKLIDAGAVGVFSKGENAEAELTDSAAAATYEISTLPSRTLHSARLVLVRRRAGAGETA